MNNTRRKGYKLSEAEKASRKATREANKQEKLEDMAEKEFRARPLSEEEETLVTAMLDLVVPESDLEEMRDLFGCSPESDGTELRPMGKATKEDVEIASTWMMLTRSRDMARDQIIFNMRWAQWGRMRAKSTLINIKLK